MTDDWSGKILDAELRRFVADTNGRRSVLIEIATPRPHVEVGGVGRGGRSHRLPVRVTGDADAAAVKATVESAWAFLEGVLATEPVWLDAAQSFVASVTGEQLPAIARSPLVRAIHPNRHLG